jgi:hypothetical protein
MGATPGAKVDWPTRSPIEPFAAVQMTWTEFAPDSPLDKQDSNPLVPSPNTSEAARTAMLTSR